MRVPNIIMLGPTGAGKSFFGNGLFGEKNPEEGTIIKFLVSILAIIEIYKLS